MAGEWGVRYIKAQVANLKQETADQRDTITAIDNPTDLVAAYILAKA